MTHRAAMFAVLAKTGPSIILNPLNGEDCESTLECLRQFGASVQHINSAEVQVSPPKTWANGTLTLDCGNSGTTMRLLAGILAGRPGLDVTLIGDTSLSRRPMGRIVKPLQSMGALIEGDTAPIRIHGCQLNPINYVSPVASAQVKSALLLAGLTATGLTSVTEPSLSRDHTERMLTALKVDLRSEGTTVSIQGGQSWDRFEFDVPGDISSAAFWIVAALIHPGSEVVLRRLGVNPTRIGILGLLDSVFHGSPPYQLSEENQALGEPVATLTIVSPDHLPSFEIGGELVPRLIDEIPVLAVLATQCEGRSVFRDAQELRVKETDRIEVVVRYLRAMGAKIEATEDGMIIEGPTPLIGTTIDSAGDHRIGMAFAIAGSIAAGETVIENAESIATSYPDFVAHFHQLTGQQIGVMA
jgi:3-phosphoshikimate 1-carboxyvinyltransferase